MIDHNLLKILLQEQENNYKELEMIQDIKTQNEIKKKINKKINLIEKIKLFFQNEETLIWHGNLSQEEQLFFIDDITVLKNINNEILLEIENMIFNIDASDMDKNFFLEIRAGAGGDEASLFAHELYMLYEKYAHELDLQTYILDTSYNEVGGIKSIKSYFKGDLALKYFQFESGVHRVQRVPSTEKKGRVHTSTITVAVLPEEDDNTKYFNLNDVKVEYSTAQGAGGQHVNKTESAVILTHMPTGIKVKNQDERSQHKNKELAFKILKLRVQEFLTLEKQKEVSDDRWQQIGTGERNEKIRTYNFPQNRLTDHRFNLTVHNLPEIMNGKFQDFFQSMLEAFKQNLINEKLL
jgi:peptide chain release factor 1